MTMPKKLPTPEEFRALLAKYVKRRKLSTRDAADKLDVSHGTIASWLKATRNPSRIYIRLLTEKLRK